MVTLKSSFQTEIPEDGLAADLNILDHNMIDEWVYSLFEALKFDMYASEEIRSALTELASLPHELASWSNDGGCSDMCYYLVTYLVTNPAGFKEVINLQVTGLWGVPSNEVLLADKTLRHPVRLVLLVTHLQYSFLHPLPGEKCPAGFDCQLMCLPEPDSGFCPNYRICLNNRSLEVGPTGPCDWSEDELPW